MNGRSAMYKDEDRAPIKGGGGGGSQPNPDCEVSIENIKESSN